MVTWLGSAGSGAGQQNRDMCVSNTCRVVRATATLPAVLEHNVCGELFFPLWLSPSTQFRLSRLQEVFLQRRSAPQSRVWK